jgi:C-methyltransferase
MNSLEGLGGKAMAADVPFHRFDRVIDVGGSRGHFLHKILSNNPTTKGVLFDRPEVIAHAKPMWLDDNGAFSLAGDDRIEIIEGNFFDSDALPKAKDGDAFVLRYILHDWGENDCARILSNLATSMKGTNARLFIAESAMPDRHSGPSPMVIPHNIDMLMLNVFGTAVERTPEMWNSLLEKSGFEIQKIHPTRSIVHFVEATLKEDSE